MGNPKYAATRLTVAIAAAVLVVTATVVPVASASTSDFPPPDKTALIMGGTAAPTPNDYWVEVVRNQFIEPTHPGEVSDYKAVTTPEEFWPLTGLFRLLGIGLAAVDPQHVSRELLANFFPDEPWWQLSGLFDLTVDQSNQAGVADLEAAMTKYGNDRLVIYGYSQGASVAIREKRKLAEQYPWGTKAPDIGFVLGGDFNLPNGGLAARFPGFYIPVLDFTFNGPEPTDTQFHTDVITRQYDAFADFPLYPLNLVADLNAVLGFLFVHAYPFDVSLADDSSKYTLVEHGDTDYYFFETKDLPLFTPLRLMGVPESVIDVVEPVFRVLVELGYDRSIPPWMPTPARLIPMHNPATVTADLVNALREGLNNAFGLIGLPPLMSIPAPPGTKGAEADLSQPKTWTAGTRQMIAERIPAEGNPPEHLGATFDPNPADDVVANVEQNPTEDSNATLDPNPADDINETPSRGTSSGSQQTTATSHQFKSLTSTGTMRRRHTTSNGELLTATSSSVGSPSTGNSSRGSTNGEPSGGSANGDSSPSRGGSTSWRLRPVVMIWRSR